MFLLSEILVLLAYGQSAFDPAHHYRGYGPFVLRNYEKTNSRLIRQNATSRRLRSLGRHDRRSPPYSISVATFCDFVVPVESRGGLSL